MSTLKGLKCSLPEFTVFFNLFFLLSSYKPKGELI